MFAVIHNREDAIMNVSRISVLIGAMVLAGGAPIASSGNPTPLGAVFDSVLGNDCGDEACIAVARGFVAFFDRTPHGLTGNGRACADCHMAIDNFQLSPADVERRYQVLQLVRRWNKRADDPLFRPVDADDFRVNGAAASDFSELRENGLVRVTLPLPSNVRLIDPATNAPSDETFVDVWRAVPTVEDVRITGPDGVNPWARGPNVSGGYQLDGRKATLQEQAAGAFVAHAQVLGAPSQRLLDDLAAFQNLLFSSPRVRALADAVAAGTSPLPDADPVLSSFEQQGKAVFTRACGQCHGGPGQSTPQAPAVRYHEISSQCPRPVDTVLPARFNFKPCPQRLARNARIYEITLPTGATIRRVSSDPGRALLTGFAGIGPPGQEDWNKLDVPTLRGIRNTAPYFHNNSADTLEEVVDHYMEFFKRVPTVLPPGAKLPPAISTDGIHADRPPTPEEIPALLAYLRRL
jgi:cytochrome c553